ncbi:MAG TPA: MFS transporter [Acidobacteriaceae bacterium]|jgi:MFS transporter, FHS family, glucose/mannose:H+ symporter|nr:MFS transporter [Acidobacteriaceae bacterium]
MAPTRTRDPHFVLLCFGFVICGIVTVLPGPLLPVLAARWGLRDVQSGAFFAAEFAASTLAAIMAPRRMRWSLPRGYALLTVGVLLLLVAGRALSPSLGHDLALGSFTLIGFGIGLSVTATNLLVGSAPTENRARRLSVVNLWWGIGAVACPWMVAVAERSANLPILLALVAGGAVAMFVLFLPLREEPGAASVTTFSLARDGMVLLYFAVLLFLYVGVENAVGGWVATYTYRFSGLTLAWSSMMVSVYWLALLAGRGLGSLALRWVPERAVLVPSLAVSLTAVTMLLAPHTTDTVVAAVTVAGLGFGPVFPIGVSRMLARLSDHRNTGWVFATCAGGGAVVPWLTGLFSTSTGSLRVGFGVPAAALGVILLLALVEDLLLGETPVQQPDLRL